MAKNAKIEAKAKAAESKSEGMRLLFEAGYEAAEIKEIMGVPYGFVYGVGKRGGFITPTPRAAKPKAAAKASARPAAKAKATAKPAPRVKAAAKPAAKAKARSKA